MTTAEIKVMTDESGYLTENEVREVLVTITNKRDYALVLVLWKTGARISEIVGQDKRRATVSSPIKFEKVDDPDPLIKQRISFEKKTIMIRNLKRKGGKKGWKTVYVDDELIATLKEYSKDMHDTEPLFSITRYQAFRIVRKVFKQAGHAVIGVKEAHPHHLRHSLAMQGINRGVALPFIQRQLGHSSLHATGFYLKLKEEDIRKEVEKMWGSSK